MGNDQNTSRESLRKQRFRYLLRICLRPTVAGQPCPDLGNQNSPQLYLRLTALRLGNLLEIEHTLREGNKVRNKVSEWGGMRLRQQRQEERARLTTSLPNTWVSKRDLYVAGEPTDPQVPN